MSRDFLWILIGTSLVTVLSRTLPLLLLSKMDIPEWVMRFLKHVPVAVMAALVAQALFTDGESWRPLAGNAYLTAFVPTLIVAVLTRSLLATVVAGILSMMWIQMQ